jgi:hypothetical protein
MIYGIHVNSAGEIAKMQQNYFKPDENLIGFTVTEESEYYEIIHNIAQGIFSRGDYRVDITASNLTIINLSELNDTTAGKFQKVIFADHSYSLEEGFILNVFTKNNRPHLSLRFYGLDVMLQSKIDKTVKFYATAENDITILYEMFVFDTSKLLSEKVLELPITSIAMENLLLWKFSLYTRKFVSHCACKFEWPHPLYLRIKE